jgi:hypothetical protein
MSIQIIDGALLHEFRAKNRKAEIYSHKNGYVVRMFENQIWKEDRVITGHTEQYAEECAENFTLEIF